MTSLSSGCVIFYVEMKQGVMNAKGPVREGVSARPSNVSTRGSLCFHQDLLYQMQQYLLA
jgi:hypothetical protein